LEHKPGVSAVEPGPNREIPKGDDQTGLPETGEFVALYCPGPRGIEFRVDAEGTRRWYLYDGLRSMLAEVTDAGAITAARKYDVYGALRTGSDEGAGSQKFVGSLGHSTEPSTGGLIYMRARWYDPAVGRFVSEDPSGQRGELVRVLREQPDKCDRPHREMAHNTLAGSSPDYSSSPR